MHRRFLPALGLVLGGLTLPAGAQQVDVQLREEGSRAPIIGAIVRLLGETGDQPHAQGLSNEGGRITLQAPAPGRYRLKVDRIGWVGLVTPSFELAAGQRFQTEVLLSDIRMDLPTVEVRGESICGRQFTNDATAANLWQEIDRALTATVLSQREAALPLHVREFQRALRLNAQPRLEWNTGASIVRGPVYRTLPPALLATEGFVLADEASDSTIFAVPDAALLVSAEFTDTHCFRTVRPRDGRIGLYFEPIPRRQVTDIQGTLWLDAASHELQFLEYTYTGLMPLPRRVELGGRVEFTRLPTGQWIVSHWYVRTPVTEQVTLRTTTVRGMRAPTIDLQRVTGYMELGATVRIAEENTPVANHAILTGRVADPTTGSGLRGAEITVEGVPEPVLTDADGRFVLVTRLHGERQATLRHPRLRLVNRAPSQVVVLSIGDTTTVNFLAPTMAELVRAFCGNPRNRSGILGSASDAEGRPLWNALVTVSWRTPTGEVREELARTNAQGVYGFCNLPPDELLVIRVGWPDGTTTEEEWELAPRQFEWVELRGGER